MRNAKVVLIAAMLTATSAYPTGTLAAQSDSHWFAFQPVRDAIPLFTNGILTQRKVHNTPPGIRG